MFYSISLNTLRVLIVLMALSSLVTSVLQHKS